MLTTQVQHLDEQTFDPAVAEGVTIVDFYADWCGPCRMLAPAVEEAAQKLAGTATVAKVNVDQCPALAGRFRIQAIPLVVVLRDGQEVNRLVGLQTADGLCSAAQEALR
jgi:thioredoxin 1